MIEYRDFCIEYDPPFIGIRSCDWQYVHKDYDGAEDSGDRRLGYAPTLEQAKIDIDNMIEEEEMEC